MQEQHVRRNVLALVGDFVFFSIGFAFFDPVVIVPAFVKEFTGSALLIGALSAFTPPALIAEAVRLAPEGGVGGPLWVGDSIMLLALAGGAFLWFKRARPGTAKKWRLIKLSNRAHSTLV